jgi:catechol 2,3-dioxygenase-like lactoylglutathione lyase family enzyme
MTQPVERPAAAGPMTAIRIDHAGASVADLATAIGFYVGAFGFEVEESFSIPGTSVDGVVLRHPHGARVELFRHPESITAPTGHPVDSTLRRGWFQLAFRVDDVVAAHHHVLGAGAVTVREPFLAPDGRSRVAFVVDPDGNLIELIERRPTR